MTGKPLTPTMKLRKYNDRCNRTVPKIDLCGKMEGYSSEIGPDDKSILIQFKNVQQ
jgi:hypothetical protein